MKMNETFLSPSHAVLLFVAAVLVFLRLRKRGFPETVSNLPFAFGIVLLVLEVVLPSGFLGRYTMTAHMAKHISLLLIVPPLLLSGADPEFLNRLFDRPAFKKIGGFVFRPVITWLFGMSAMWVWQIPELARLAEISPLLQAAQAIMLLFFGTIFIWPVFTPTNFMKLQPLGRGIYLFSACTGCTVLGILITFAPAGLYAGASGAGATGLVSLTTANGGSTSAVDQEMSGLMMWVPACSIYVTNVMISLARWYRQSEREDAVAGEIGIKKLSRS